MPCDAQAQFLSSDLPPSVMRRTIIIGVQVVCLSCGPTGPTTIRSVPSGVWGGDHVRLTVSETAAAIEFDCAHGTLDGPIALDRDGHFDVAGLFVREHGGPIHVDEVLEREPARYSGAVEGRTMTLIVTSSQRLGPFTLALGRLGRLVKCL